MFIYWRVCLDYQFKTLLLHTSITSWPLGLKGQGLNNFVVGGVMGCSRVCKSVKMGLKCS